MEEKTTKTRKQRSLSKDTPLGEAFTNRIKACDSVFDDGYDITRNRSDSNRSDAKGSPTIKRSNKKSASQKK